MIVSHTLVEAVRLVVGVPARIAIAKTLSASDGSVRRHLSFTGVHMLNQLATAVCATEKKTFVTVCQMLSP